MFIIKLSNGLSHTGYNYWNTEHEIAALDINDATQFETEEEALKVFNGITDVEPGEGRTWGDVVTLEQAQFEWDEVLGRGGEYHNPYRHLPAIKDYLESPNKVIIAMECRGVFFNTANNKDGDPFYFDVIKEASRTAGLEFTYIKYRKELEKALAMKAPEDVSEATLREYLINNMANMFGTAYDELGRDCAIYCLADEYMITSESGELTLVGQPTATLIEIAEKFVACKEELLNLGGMDFHIFPIDKINQVKQACDDLPYKIMSPFRFALMGTTEEIRCAYGILRRYATTENVSESANDRDTLQMKDVFISAASYCFNGAPLALQQLSGFMPWDSPKAVQLQQKEALEETAQKAGIDLSQLNK